MKIPLAGLDIKSSEEINYNDVGVCIFSINLNAEQKVKRIINNKFNAKFKYYSISPDSQYSLPIFAKL